MELFEAIVKANQGLQGRVQGIQYGIVSSIEEPLGFGRVQCFDASKGGKSTTDWLFRVLPMPGFSPPLPSVGHTVLLGFIDGDPHKGCYFGNIQNAVNPTLNSGQDLVMTIGNTTITITPEGAINIIGVSSVTINGKEVATIGALDTGNDTLTTRGW